MQAPAELQDPAELQVRAAGQPLEQSREPAESQEPSSTDSGLPGAAGCRRCLGTWAPAGHLQEDKAPTPDGNPSSSRYAR